jgi:cell division topological specificity factor MinE
MADAFAACVWAIYRLTPFRGFVGQNVQAAGLPVEVARLSIRNLARCIVEILRFPELGEIRYEGWENVEAVDGGIIIATMHFGNWELLGAALAAKGLPLHVLVQPPSQDAFGKLFLEFRAKVGVTTHANSGAASLMHDRSDIPATMMEAIRAELVSVLGKYVEIDQEAMDVQLEKDAGAIGLVLNIPIKRVKTEQEASEALAAMQALQEEKDKAKATSASTTES